MPRRRCAKFLYLLAGARRRRAAGVDASARARAGRSGDGAARPAAGHRGRRRRDACPRPLRRERAGGRPPVAHRRCAKAMRLMRAQARRAALGRRRSPRGDARSRSPRRRRARRWCARRREQVRHAEADHAQARRERERVEQLVEQGILVARRAPSRRAWPRSTSANESRRRASDRSFAAAELRSARAGLDVDGALPGKRAPAIDAARTGGWPRAAHSRPQRARGRRRARR